MYTPFSYVKLTMLTYLQDEISADRIRRDKCSYTYCTQNINNYETIPGTAHYHNIIML